MNKLILKDIKRTKDLNNYIFARGGIKIEGNVNFGHDCYGNHLGCEYTDLSLNNDILVLEKDKIITDDEVTDYQIKRDKSSPYQFVSAYFLPIMLKYAIPTDDNKSYNIVKIFCDELITINPDQFSKLKTLGLEEVEDE